MGLVRTKNQVVAGQWNHLRVRRRDWKGFLQLNDGPETVTLSKVLLIYLLTSLLTLCPLSVLFHYIRRVTDGLNPSCRQRQRGRAMLHVCQLDSMV